MKDLFKSYHKQKVLSHLGILGISCVLAVSINMFVLSGTNWDLLKASITEIQNENSISEDINFIHSNNSVIVKNTKQIDNIEQLSFSVAYNHDLLVLQDSQSNIDWVSISSISETPWFSNYILTFTQPISLEADSQIIELGYQRNSNEPIYLNPININFMDSDGMNYSLSASSLIF